MHAFLLLNCYNNVVDLRFIELPANATIPDVSLCTFDTIKSHVPAFLFTDLDMQPCSATESTRAGMRYTAIHACDCAQACSIRRYGSFFPYSELYARQGSGHVSDAIGVDRVATSATGLTKTTDQQRPCPARPRCIRSYMVY